MNFILICSLALVGYLELKKQKRVGQKSVTQSVRFRCPTSAQLSRVVKADEISALEPTQPLRYDTLT